MEETNKLYEFVKVFLLDFKIYSPQYRISFTPLSVTKWILKLNEETDCYDFIESKRLVYKVVAKIGKHQIIFDEMWIDEELNEIVHTMPVMCRGNK